MGHAPGRCLTVTSPRGELKPHPLVLVARDSSALFSKLVAQLGLDQEPVDTAPDRRLRDSLGRRRAA